MTADSELSPLPAFILARLDDWERLARRAQPVQTGSRDEGQPPEHVSWRRSAGHPDFALRHIATLRAIVASECSPYPAYAVPATRTLQLLASDFSTHSDYDPAWRMEP